MYSAATKASPAKSLRAFSQNVPTRASLIWKNPEVIRLDPLNKLGSPVEIIRSFGGKPEYERAIHDLTRELYQAA
jgi:hypothetical protein